MVFRPKIFYYGCNFLAVNMDRAIPLSNRTPVQMTIIANVPPGTIYKSTPGQAYIILYLISRPPPPGDSCVNTLWTSVYFIKFHSPPGSGRPPPPPGHIPYNPLDTVGVNNGIGHNMYRCCAPPFIVIHHRY